MQYTNNKTISNKGQQIHIKDTIKSPYLLLLDISERSTDDGSLHPNDSSRLLLLDIRVSGLLVKTSVNAEWI